MIEVLTMTENRISPPLFKVGDRVKIRYSDSRARIVELRGPLAPGGMQVYCIRVPRGPKPAYIEVREDQLVLIQPISEK